MAKDGHRSARKQIAAMTPIRYLSLMSDLNYLPAAPTTPSPFFRLPQEIRDNIYYFVFKDAAVGFGLQRPISVSEESVLRGDAAPEAVPLEPASIR